MVVAITRRSTKSGRRPEGQFVRRRSRQNSGVTEVKLAENRQ
jgi:hypothetical protein